MKAKIKFIAILLLTVLFSCKQTEKNNDQQDESAIVSNSNLGRIEPPNWWIGFEASELQLMVYENGIGNAWVEVNYPGISVNDIHKARSENYLFVDLSLEPETKAGKFDLVFTFEDGQEKRHTYEIKERLKPGEEYNGFDSSDAIILITPDRFANGNESNDSFEYLNEKTTDRTDNYARHGGDIRGITSHLDYIQDLGFTAIWPMPLLTNDMHEGSYHGYAITDLYQIDPRYGTLEGYLELSNEARKKGIKLIMDQVANHCGLEHWWMKDLPFEDWVNYQADFEKLPTPVEKMRKPNGEYDWEQLGQYFTNSNHRRTTNQDLYASEIDRKGNNEGWFVPFMPDLNQKNPFMANYIIQNSIWWIETADLGGIRQDTYPYPDKQFMSDWAGAIMTEYPNFSIVGEEWSYNPLLIGYWQEGAKNRDGYDSNLRSTMDFAMKKNIVDALNEKEQWNTGLVKIYEGLANDFVYPSPKDIMLFPDNHDMSRIFTQFEGDIVKTKMALSIILTLPRIPQIYYGTEILMNDFEKPGDHGLIRTDFPGGWAGDSVNAFTGEGLDDAQKDMQAFLKKVLNYRKSSKAIHEGRTIHFAPKDETYFLFRIIDGETVVLMLNKNDKPITIELKRFAEVELEGKSLKNIITGESFSWDEEISFEGKGVTLLTTKLD